MVVILTPIVLMVVGIPGDRLNGKKDPYTSSRPRWNVRDAPPNGNWKMESSI